MTSLLLMEGISKFVKYITILADETTAALIITLD